MGWGIEDEGGVNEVQVYVFEFEFFEAGAECGFDVFDVGVEFCGDEELVSGDFAFGYGDTEFGFGFVHWEALLFSSLYCGDYGIRWWARSYRRNENE